MYIKLAWCKADGIKHSCFCYNFRTIKQNFFLQMNALEMHFHYFSHSKSIYFDNLSYLNHDTVDYISHGRPVQDVNKVVFFFCEKKK